MNEKICRQCLEPFIDESTNNNKRYCYVHSTSAARRRRNRQRIKRIIFKILGGPKCRKCDFSDVRALQLDHVKGNGNKERAKFRGDWESFYKAILRNPKLYQILCANCNWIKRVENGESNGTKN